MPEKRTFEEYEDEDSLNKLAKKSRDSPFVPIGLAGLVAVCGIGAYKYKSRGAMTTSMFMMQLRVAAQGAVVGCLALGITYSMLRDYVFTKAEAEKEPKYGH